MHSNNPTHLLTFKIKQEGQTHLTTKIRQKQNILHQKHINEGAHHAGSHFLRENNLQKS